MFSIKLGGGGKNDDMSDLIPDLSALSDLPSDLSMNPGPGFGTMSIEAQLWDEVIRDTKPVPNVNPADLEEFSPHEAESEEEVQPEPTRVTKKQKNKRGKRNQKPKSQKPDVPPAIIEINIKDTPRPAPVARPDPIAKPAPAAKAASKPIAAKPTNPKPVNRRKSPKPQKRETAPKPAVKKPEQKEAQQQQQQRSQKLRQNDDMITISVADLTALLAKNNERVTEQVVQFMTSPRLFNAQSLRTRLLEIQNSNTKAFLSSSRLKTAGR